MSGWNIQGRSASIKAVNNQAMPLFELYTGPTDHPVLSSVELRAGIGANMSVGFGAPATAGVGRRTLQNAAIEHAEDTSSAPGVGLAVEWATPPAAPANFLRRASWGTQFGLAIQFDFPRGLMLAANSSVVVWLIATNSSSNPTVFDLQVYFDA